MSIEDFIITVFCFVADSFAYVIQGKKLGRRGFQPKLDNTEVITMKGVDKLLGIDTDKGVWTYFCVG